MEFTSFAEKKINDDVEKMFGDKDPELKMLTKLAMLKELYGDEVDTRIQDTLKKIKRCAVNEFKLIQDELKCSLDASGNVIISEPNINE
jgi:hypothetical protein